MSVIVSLTSTSKRLPVLRYTLLSLLDQNYKPDRIVLCLSKEPYLIDDGVKVLPDWLQSMIEEGDIEIRWCENTGPYRKLIPTYASADNKDWLVTCDDDVIYGPKWLSSLVQSGKAYPEAIVCGRARRPTKNLWKGRQSYINWPIVPPGSMGKKLLPIGVAGVLYRKPLLDEATMRSDDFKEIAPKQDDLWFNFAREVRGKDVVVALEVDNHVYPIDAPDALSEMNVQTVSGGWENFFKAAFSRVLVKFKGYIGMSVCGNDIALRRLEAYRARLRK